MLHETIARIEKRPAQCFVTAEDYRRYWQREPEASLVLPLFIGPDRRSGRDRRSAAHERRWEASRGRRLRVSDRRTGGAR